MTHIYYVEVWNPKSNRYDIVHTGQNLERAKIQTKKSYVDRNGKNLVRIRECRIENIIIYRNDNK